jgi:hypothetical protein
MAIAICMSALPNCEGKTPRKHRNLPLFCSDESGARGRPRSFGW